MKRSPANIRTGLRLLMLSSCLFLAAGCDSTTRYQVLTTIFDGVPRLPPQEEYCQDYVERMAQAGADAEGGREAEGSGKSLHKPFAEKRCSDCHAFDKPGGLLRPRREICFLCHKDFIQGKAVHGPVAVGDCLACHHPHNSAFPALLLQDPGEICGKCHQENRLAGQMHDRIREKGMVCTDCHNPHFGEVDYFLN